MHVPTGVLPRVEVQAAGQLELVRHRPPAEHRPLLDHLDGAGIDDLPPGEVPRLRIGETIAHGGVLERTPGECGPREEAERAIEEPAPDPLIRGEPERHHPHQGAEEAPAGSGLDQGDAEHGGQRPDEEPQAPHAGVLRRAESEDGDEPRREDHGAQIGVLAECRNPLATPPLGGPGRREAGDLDRGPGHRGHDDGEDGAPEHPRVREDVVERDADQDHLEEQGDLLQGGPDVSHRIDDDQRREDPDVEQEPDRRRRNPPVAGAGVEQRGEQEERPRDGRDLHREGPVGYLERDREDVEVKRPPHHRVHAMGRNRLRRPGGGGITRGVGPERRGHGRAGSGRIARIRRSIPRRTFTGSPV